MDPGEPACFACGFWDLHWDSRKTPKQRWNKARLERAHIIAKSSGGSDTPQNFLLLCRLCHAEAPMTKDPAIMLAWARRQESWMTREVRKLREAISVAGVDPAKFEAWSRNPDADRLYQLALEQIGAGVHFGDHGGAISSGTEAEAIKLAMSYARVPACPSNEPAKVLTASESSLTASAAP